jgi:outer membrane biosynthesis protein TonB
MNRISTESKISFVGTIIFHSLLLLMALFMSLNNKPQPIEFVELSFTAIEMPAVRTPARTAEPVVNRQQPITDVQPRQAGPTVIRSSGTTSNNNAQTTPTTVPQVAPPRSTLSMDSDPQSIRLPGSKLDVNDTRENSSYDRNSSSSNQEKSNFSRDNNSEALPNSGSSVSSGISAPSNSNVGKEVKGFSIAWQDGGVRNKTSGTMPRYPENSNKEVQIKVQVTVAPDGSITKIVPLQKADYEFENSVNVALRTWKFEKLKQGVPEESQTGIITFNFKLE